MIDEVTTNLDEKNIAAVAEALHKIIDRRKGHRSFQLLVITHDESFVEMLGKREHADHYYRVFKDPSSGFSRIQRQPIHL